MPPANPPNAEAYAWVTNVRKKESAYGVLMADADIVMDWLVGIEPGFFSVTPTYRDDGKEMNGFSGPTKHQIERWDGEKSMKFYFSPQVYQYLLALQLGNVAIAGSADPWIATNKWPNICTLSPASTTWLEAPLCSGFTADFLAYKGVMVEETDVTINGLSSIELAAKLICDGSQTAKPSLVLPASVYAVQQLIGANVSLKLGPLGTEDLTSDFRSAKVNIKNGLTRRNGVSAGLFSPGFNFGGNNPAPTISLTIIGDKSHVVHGYMLNKTVLKLDLKADPVLTPNRYSQWKLNQCIVKCKEVPSGSESQLQIDIMPEWNSVDAGPMTIINATQEAAYLG